MTLCFGILIASCAFRVLIPVWVLWYRAELRRQMQENLQVERSNFPSNEQPAKPLTMIPSLTGSPLWRAPPWRAYAEGSFGKSSLEILANCRSRRYIAHSMILKRLLESKYYREVSILGGLRIPTLWYFGTAYRAPHVYIVLEYLRTLFETHCRRAPSSACGIFRSEALGSGSRGCRRNVCERERASIGANYSGYLLVHSLPA